MFGSYDREGVDPQHKMNVAATVSATSFDLALSKVLVDDDAAPLSSTQIIFDPQAAWILMNPNDWKKLQASVKAKYPNLVCAPSSDFRYPDCYFKDPCSTTQFNNHTLSLVLAAEDPPLEPISFQMSDIFVDSTRLDPNTTNKYCYLAAGNNTDNPVTLTMVLGTVALENYYVVFDMTPTQGDSLATNRVGYGKINPRNVLGDSIYNLDDVAFNRSMYDASSSYDYTLYSKPIPPGDISATTEKSRQKELTIGVILGCAALSAGIICFVYFNPDKCKRKKSTKRGQSLAYDDDALHQVNK